MIGDVFLIMIKRVVLITVMIQLCGMCGGNVRETSQLVETQKQELVDAFIEKVEYVYNYELWFVGDPLIFTESGYREKALQVDLYWKDGVYYFIPIKDCNAELEIEGIPRKVRYNELNEGHYIFCVLRQRSGIERDYGIWYLEKPTSLRADDIKDITYLGMVEIDTTGEKKPETMELTENGYVNAIVDSIRYRGDLPIGNYKVYIGWYGYVGVNSVGVTGVIRQNETYRWFAGWAARNEDGSYDASAHSTNGASEMFPTVEEIPFAYDDAMYIVEAERLVLDLKITEQDQRKEGAVVTDQAKEGQPKTKNKTVEVTEEEAKEKIKELYNYYQWFYENMPYDIESLLEEGETYSIFTDGNGGIFWTKAGISPSKGAGGIYRSELQTDIADLPLYSYTMGTSRQSKLKKIGKMEWHKPELGKPELPPLVEDEYIREVEAYIRNDLTDRGKVGKYQIYFGRYENLGSDVMSISVAVTGEETFYLQCWVTKYPDGTYECFPVGGSYMGEEKTGLKKAERIIQLERLRMELEIN